MFVQSKKGAATLPSTYTGMNTTAGHTLLLRCQLTSPETLPAGTDRGQTAVWRPALALPRPTRKCLHWSKGDAQLLNVCIVTAVRIPTGDEVFLSSDLCRPVLGPTQSLPEGAPGAVPLGVMSPRSKADLSPPSSSKLMNEWSCPPPCLHGMGRDS
jgi:hypothetical protein